MTIYGVREPRATDYLFQKLSVAVQRGNGTAGFFLFFVVVVFFFFGGGGGGMNS